MSKRKSERSEQKDLRTKAALAEAGTAASQGPAFRSSHTKTERVLALLALVFFAVVLLLLLFTAFTGGSAGQLLALLFCLIVVPCLLFAFRLYLRYTAKKRGKK